MGILGDNLPNWLPDDPNQKAAARQGLLAFGAALLGGKGNLGGILGDGLMAGSQTYHGALGQQQQQALRDAQMQQTTLENKKLQGQIDEPAQLASILQGPGPVGAPAPAPAAAQGGQGGIPALDSALDGYRAPASAVAGLPQLGQPAAAPPAQQAGSLFDTYMSYGDRLTRAGKPAAAKQYYELAEKLRPKLKEQRTLTVDGKRVMANVFEDGTTQAVDGFAPDAEKLAFQNTGGSTVALDPFTGKPVNTIQNTQSPDSVATNQTTRRGQDLTHADNDAPALVSKDAIINAAVRYNLDGTLPPMGMGKSGTAGRSEILNTAAELAKGTDPAELRRNQVNFKNNVASEGAALKAFTSGKLGNSVRSFNVLQAHLDTMGSMAEALGNGDTQAFNKLANMIAAQTGKAPPTNFEAVKHIVGDEIVKAVTGSAGALGDREAAAKTIAAANSPGQLRGVVETYKELARGQINGLQQQYETSTGRKDFDRYLSQQSQESRKPAALAELPKKAPAGDHPADISSLLNKYGAK